MTSPRWRLFPTEPSWCATINHLHIYRITTIFSMNWSRLRLQANIWTIPRSWLLSSWSVSSTEYSNPLVAMQFVKKFSKDFTFLLLRALCLLMTMLFLQNVVHSNRWLYGLTVLIKLLTVIQTTFTICLVNGSFWFALATDCSEYVEKWDWSLVGFRATP